MPYKQRRMCVDVDGLPNYLVEPGFIKLYEEMWKAAQAVVEYQFGNPAEVQFNFHPDRMAKDLGHEVAVRIEEMTPWHDVTVEVRARLAAVLGAVVKRLFQGSIVTAKVQAFVPLRDAFWTADEI